MALRLVIPPTELPVSLAEAKAQCRVDSLNEDELIARLCAVATAHIDGKDGWLNRALKPQTYEMLYDSFPCGAIAIPMRPLIDVVSVKYDDEFGIEQTEVEANYYVDTVSDPGWVVPVSDFSWPSTLSAINAVRVRFTAGYADESGDINTVPEPIRHAILMMVADMYQQRESMVDGSMSKVPMQTTVERLLHPFQVFL